MIQRVQLLGEDKLLYLLPNRVGISFYPVEQLIPTLAPQLRHRTAQPHLPFGQWRGFRPLNQLHNGPFHLHASIQRVCSEEYHTWNLDSCNRQLFKSSPCFGVLWKLLIALSSWFYLVLEAPTPPTVYLYAFLAILGGFGGELLLVRGARSRPAALGREPLAEPAGASD